MTFSNDFIGPAAFYNVLSNRSPLLLNKSLRMHKKEHKKSLGVNFFNAPKSGRLLVANVTAHVLGTHLDNIIIHNIKEKFLKYGERTQVLFPTIADHNNDSQTKTTNQVKSAPVSHLIVIIFVTDCDDESVMKDPNVLITSTLKDLNKMSSDSNLYFNVFEIACQHPNNIRHLISPHNEQLESCRSLFSPLFLNRQCIILMRKLRNSFLTISNLSSKFEIGIEAEFNWVSTTSNSDDNHRDQHINKFPNIFYHYSFSKDNEDLIAINNESSEVVVEQMDVIQCPWCRASFGQSNSHYSKHCWSNSRSNYDIHGWEEVAKYAVLSLLHHLDSNHLHFTYNAVSDEIGNLHIIVSRDRDHDADDQTILEEKIRPFFFQNQNKLLDVEVDMSQIDIPNITFIENSKGGKVATKTRSIDEKANQPVTIKTNNHSRPYYHARLGLPLTDYEFEFYDSDDDIDMSFEKASNIRGLNEFEDIPEGKRFVLFP